MTVLTVQFGVGACTALINIDAAGKPVQRVIRNNGIGAVICNQVGKVPAGCRTRLETAIVPAGVQVEIFERSLADERSAIHGHIHHARPVPQQSHPT